MGSQRGKNAGKPITLGRYLTGMAFLTVYHGAVHSALVVGSWVSRELAEVRRFHAQYAREVLGEVGRMEAIRLSVLAGERKYWRRWRWLDEFSVQRPVRPAMKRQTPDPGPTRPTAPGPTRPTRPTRPIRPTRPTGAVHEGQE